MTNQQSRQVAKRARTKLFRALGSADPPQLISVSGQPCEQIETFKHDSWAATALYKSPTEKVVCKFGRTEPIFGIPMTWLGRWLARRETRLLDAMRDVTNIPAPAGEISVDGKILHTAMARGYVAGHPLTRQEQVSDQFFDQLAALLSKLHERNFAYVDLHKRENVIVGDDGEPHLIDFQISFHLPDRWPGNSWPMRKLLHVFQRADEYHRLKHVVKCRPDLFSAEELAAAKRRPWWIYLHRAIAVPFRTVRRKLLVMLGIRKGKGMAHTEHTPEEAVRREIAQKK